MFGHNDPPLKQPFNCSRLPIMCDDKRFLVLNTAGLLPKKSDNHQLATQDIRSQKASFNSRLLGTFHDQRRSEVEPTRVRWIALVGGTSG